MEPSRLIVDPLAHPIVLTWPKRRTSIRSWHEHVPFAMWLVDVLRPRVVVELGVHAGDSYCAFCQAVQELDLDTRCYGVDSWHGDAHTGVYGPGVLDDLRAHHDPLYGGFSTLVRSTFDGARRRFADATVDLLHIDGYHEYDAVKHDFESWLPSLSPSGMVLLHDINVRESGFGTGRFWDELKGRYRSFEFAHGHGLGVLAVGQVRSPELAALLDAKPDDAEAVRGLFAELGGRLSLRDDVEALQRRLDEARRGRSVEPEAAGLQLFWSEGGEFSEAHSVTTPLVADGRVHDYTLPLPASARGPLRLDPGDGPGYVELHALELHAGGDDARAELVGRWPAAPDDPRLVPASGVTRLTGTTTYRFMCTDVDPQLIVDGVPDRRDARPWFVRITLRASEPTVHALVAEGARALETAELRWQAERERLLEQLAEHERRRQVQEADVAGARDRVARLETEAAEHRAAADAAEADARARAAEASDRERRLRETAERLRDVDHLLRRIAGSRGWRALNRYRHLKHRALRPFRRLIGLGELLARRSYVPALWPARELERRDDAGAWESTGRDPQFRVARPWPVGWTEVVFDVGSADRLAGRARLYVDRGSGYSESDSYELGEGAGRRTRVVRLGPEVIGLRFDPCESTGRFAIRAFTLTRVSAGHARRTDRAREAAAPESPPTSAPAPVPTAHDGGRAPAIAPYEAWLEVNEWNARRAALLRDRLAALAAPPLLSVVMPVYDPAPGWVDQAIASVAAQVYARWELCIADDASTDPAVADTLRRWAAREPRVRVVFREANGHISRATNSAAELARGDFLVFMDHDDLLSPDALGEVALHLADHPDTDVLYSDDDKIDADGRRFAPQFKPDWSPELLLSYMYWSHLLVVRRRAFDAAGGLRVGYEGAQDHDLALRLTEATDRVGHLPKVLYHWRAVAGSTATSGHAKPDSFRAGRQAVQDALDRRGIRAVAERPEWAVEAGCGIFAHAFPDDGPRVAVIIPTRNNAAMLDACLTSLEQTTYTNYEVVIVDNGSDDPATLDLLARTPHRVLRIPSAGGRFNFAAINNQAVAAIDAEHVLFLNDDTEVVSPRWLSQMVGYLGVPGVGAVGARLRFPDGRLQHAGVVQGYYDGLAGPAFKLAPASQHGYLAYTMVARNYAAVTAACLLTRRDLFLRLGGFDAQTFAVAYNDVDYCYRLRAAGQRVVFCPGAELIHHEGASRGFADDPAEPAAFRTRYGGVRDPYYSPNLSLADERFAVDARTLAPAGIAPIRTLMCAFTLNWEGAPYSQFELTARLKDAGVIDPIVYCPQDGPLRDAYEARGIRVEIFEHPLRRVRDVGAYERAVTRFAEFVAASGVDLVYGNTRQTFYAIDAARRAERPSIWNLRESEPWERYFEYLAPDLPARALACLDHPYRVVFVAHATRRASASLERRHNFVTIHNGLDRERFSALLAAWPRAAARHALRVGPEDVVLVSVGTVCERKAQLDLFEAIARLDEPTAATIRCFVVGDRPGPYSERVRDAWRSLPADRRARVAIVAETPDTAPYYAAGDVFVCTSRVESYPRVILEAMAAGLPIVTTPVYGIAEQVREDVNALCYPPGDVAALADRLARLARDRHLRATLAGNSRHVLDTLTDFEAMAAAYADVFREAWVSGRPRSCAGSSG